MKPSWRTEFLVVYVVSSEPHAYSGSKLLVCMWISVWNVKIS